MAKEKVLTKRGLEIQRLATYFEKGVPRIRPLLDHPHESVLRQIALAIKGAAQRSRAGCEKSGEGTG